MRMHGCTAHSRWWIQWETLPRTLYLHKLATHMSTWFYVHFPREAQGDQWESVHSNRKKTSGTLVFIQDPRMQTISLGEVQSPSTKRAREIQSSIPKLKQFDFGYDMVNLNMKILLDSILGEKLIVTRNCQGGTRTWKLKRLKALKSDEFGYST